MNETTQNTSYLNRTLGTVGTLWGVAGSITLLSFALTRMTKPMLEAFSGAYELGVWHYVVGGLWVCLLYTSPSPRDQRGSRMPSSA